MALLRLSTPRPLFYCAQCSTTKGPAMLQDNDSLGDPEEMTRAHARSTGHKPILVGGIGGKTPRGARGVLLVDTKAVKCLQCVDQLYVAERTGVTVCKCVERR